jgi:glutathione S-transferase
MIELYHAERCPYCIKVRQYLENAGVAYISKPVPLGSANSALKEELRTIGGKTQVPFLVDPERNVKMYESDDIIAYVREHYATARV